MIKFLLSFLPRLKLHILQTVKFLQLDFTDQSFLPPPPRVKSSYNSYNYKLNTDQWIPLQQQNLSYISVQLQIPLTICSCTDM